MSCANSKTALTFEREIISVKAVTKPVNLRGRNASNVINLNFEPTITEQEKDDFVSQMSQNILANFAVFVSQNCLCQCLFPLFKAA